MENKIRWLDTTNNSELKDIINSNQLIIATFIESDYKECLKIIKESKIKRIESYSLPEGNEIIEKEHYLFEIKDLKSEKQRNIVRDFIERYKDKNLFEIIELIEIFTRKISTELTINKLEGDIGEALFIKKCIELGFKEQIFNCCNQISKNEDRIDFLLKNKKFEIKTTSSEKHEINITDKQISENPNIVVITANFNKNDITIIDIYEEIKSLCDNQLPQSLKDNYSYYTFEEHNNFIYNLTLNKNLPIKFNFYDNSKLPKINIDGYDNIIKKITYTLNSYNEENNEEIFNKMLINKINS
ncbi:MAG: PD-(D/E)XK motif protein [Ureaplasma sp.]|nr:PD-(D/E)XK motif protein [Ureaplasma sp.]